MLFMVNFKNCTNYYCFIKGVLRIKKLGVALKTKFHRLAI
jgi:hypothetical protein